MSKSNNECLIEIAKSLEAIAGALSKDYWKEIILAELEKVRLVDESDPDRVVRRIIEEVFTR